MGIINMLKQKVSEKVRGYSYVRMMNGSIPVFSQFGDNIYASDIVKNCISCIATEISKLEPRHIRTDNDGMQKTINDSITRLFKYAPNELMTTSDFLEKCVWLWYRKSNCFIYPVYETVKGDRGIYRNYLGFYPLDPVEVVFLQDPTGTMYIKLTFQSGYNVTLPYEDIIHWRKDFSLNEFLGGDENGLPDNGPLLKVLKVNDTILQGLDKAVKASLSIKGVLKMNTMLDTDEQIAEREKFEKKLSSNSSAVLPMDLKGDYIPITSTPTVIDNTTLDFVQKKILNNYGVSYAILSGDFTDEQYQAFYEKKLEPMIISLGQAFNKTLFTASQMSYGDEVIFYPQKLLFTNVKNKIAVADILGARGALTDNQLLDLFGYPPFEGGNIRRVSLNFINRDIIDDYQMLNAKNGKGVNNNGKETEQ